MSNSLTGADVLREYLSGAGSDGAAQSSPHVSIGGYRSSSFAKSVNIELADSPLSLMQGIIIKSASGSNTLGKTQLTITQTSLKWDDGVEVDFGETGGDKLVAGSQPDRFLRIQGTSNFNEGVLKLEVQEAVHNVFSMNVVLSALALSGGTQYRATIVRNEAPFSVFDFYRCLKELATTRTSASAQLGATGSGTITISSGDLDDWPVSGWCRIVKADLSLREIVYYTSRTSTSLTVPANGRARLGSSASAGNASDTIHAVPGVAIGLAAEGVQDHGDAIELIANESTAPTGITWNTSISHVDGINVPLLEAGKQIGIWIRRDIPVAATFSKGHSVILETAFDDQVTTQRGKYRIQNESARGYVAYVGVDSMPDLNGDPDAFSAVLPISIAHALPVSDEVLYVVVRKRNGFGFISNNQKPTIIHLSSSGNEIPPVTPPARLLATCMEGGSIVIVSEYPNRGAEDYPADKLRIWVSATMPDILVDSPTEEISIAFDRMRYRFGSYSPGTYYVVIAHFRSSDSSQSIGRTGTVTILPTPAVPVSL